jgi:hypothetical protein
MFAIPLSTGNLSNLKHFAMMPSTKKITALAIAFILCAGISFAQKEKKSKKEEEPESKWKKLDELFAAQKYAQCLYTAQKYMDNDKYAKDAEPFLYASKSYLEVFKDPDKFPVKKYEEFKNPLKDALSNFAKFRKKDKTGEKFAENKEYADELKRNVIDETSKMNAIKDASKMASIARDVIKTFNTDEVMMMMSGTYLLITNNMSEGLKTTDSAVATLRHKAVNIEKPAYNEVEKNALSHSFILYSDYLVTKKDAAKAKDMIALAGDLLPENADVKNQAVKINGAESK